MSSERGHRLVDFIIVLVATVAHTSCQVSPTYAEERQGDTSMTPTDSTSWNASLKVIIRVRVSLEDREVLGAMRSCT
eukprot:scaffold5197_cov393-Prasinococcus_capsulatus_cf.AAC.4